VGLADVVALGAGLTGAVPAEGVGSVLAQAALRRTASAGVASRVRGARRELPPANVTTTAEAVIRKACSRGTLAANAADGPTNRQR
jgi:hypothetical protein